MKRNFRRGTVMLMAMFFMVCIGLMASAYVRLLPYRFSVAQAEQNDLQGQYVAESGILNLCAYLKQGVSLSRCPRRQALSGGWEYNIPKEPVSILTEDNSLYYRVECEALHHGQLKRRAVATIQVGPPITTYAFFHSGFGANGDKHAAFPYESELLGDVYVKGEWRVKHFDRSVTRPNPMVRGTVFATEPSTDTVAPDKADYTDADGYNDKPYDVGPDGAVTANATLYNRLYRDGVNGVKVNSPTIPLPESETMLAFQNGAWGIKDGVNEGTQPLPSSPGIFVNTNAAGQLVGGVYINGDVGQMRLSVDAGGNAVTELDFPNPISGPTGGTSAHWKMVDAKAGMTLSSDPAKNHGISNSFIAPGDHRTVLVSDSGDYYVLNGESNGVVYVDGSVNGINGTVKGQKTIAATQNVVINGEILKSDTPRGTDSDPNAVTASSEPDVLGIAKGTSSADTRLDVKISTPTADNKYYVYANLLGLGSADLEDGGSSIPSSGKLYLKGQVVQSSTVPGHTQKLMDFFGKSNLSLTLDKVAAPYPPPFWPRAEEMLKLRAYVDMPVSR